MSVRAPRGTTDLLADAAKLWERIKQTAAETFALYGYNIVETPTFEQLDVFVRGIGEATDVVGKEMFYVYSDKALDKIRNGEPLKPEESLALRPEGTAGVVRGVVEHNLVPPGAPAVKLYYAGSMYRHERPQKGRLRQFHQIGVEFLGASEPTADAETVIMLMEFFAAVGLERSSMRLLLNSMGGDACRPLYREQVRDYILAHAGDLCPECVRRANTNPLRAFDCKNPECQVVMADAPLITDALCDDCREHYGQVKDLLDAAGVSYIEDPRLVRGLDYYTRTVFEVQVVDGLGSQNAIGGGGRYDKLVEEFGGKPTPGLGFAVGFERIVLALQAQGSGNVELNGPAVFVAAVDARARQEAFALTMRLRAAGFPAELDHQARSLKSQFKLADKLACANVVVIGPDELAGGYVTIRSMDTHSEQKVAPHDIEAHL